MFGGSKAQRAIKAQRRIFNIERRSAFYADMAHFMQDDLPPYQVLEKMRSVALRRKRTHKMAAIYGRIMAGVVSGKGLGLTIAQEVPANEAVVLVGAEQAGPKVLSGSLERLGVLLRRQDEAKRMLRKSLWMNGAFLAAILGVIYTIVKLVVPQLKASLTEEMQAQLTIAKGYFAFGDFVLAYGVWIFFAVIALGAFVFWSVPNWYKERQYWSRSWFDAHLVPWSFNSRTNATYFLFSVSSMLGAGLPFKVAIKNIIPSATPWARHHMRRMLGLLEAGASEVDSMATGMLPEETSNRLGIYSISPNFTSVMHRLADDNFKEYERAVAVLSVSMRFAMLILMFMFIAATLLAVFDFSNVMAGLANAKR